MKRLGLPNPERLTFGEIKAFFDRAYPSFRDGEKKRVRRRCRAVLSICGDHLTPPEVATGILRLVRGATGVIDPFLEIKQRELEQACTLLERRFGSEEDLLGLMRLSAIGEHLRLLRGGISATRGAVSVPAPG